METTRTPARPSSFLVAACCLIALTCAAGAVAGIRLRSDGSASSPTARVAPRAATPEARPAAPAGAQLTVGRIFAAPDSATGGVRVRVRVSNTGAAALAGRSDTRAILLVDGVVAAEQAVGPLDPSGFADLRFLLDSCDAGRHSLTVVVDAAASIREADERDNARTTELAYGC